MDDAAILITGGAVDEPRKRADLFGRHKGAERLIVGEQDEAPAHLARLVSVQQEQTYTANDSGEAEPERDEGDVDDADHAMSFARKTALIMRTRTRRKAAIIQAASLGSAR